MLRDKQFVRHTSNNTRALEAMIAPNIFDKVHAYQDVLEVDTDGVHLDLELVVLERRGLGLPDPVECV